MANITIRIDDQIKEKFDTVLKEMGLSMSGAINLFATQVILERGLPFKPRAKTAEEKYNEYFNSLNVSRILKGQEQAGKGTLIFKTTEELEDMEND